MIDVKVCLLFDYYGQFLTAKQRDVMHLYFENDYSLSEIAQVLGVSRQAVHDMIKKARKSLEECEERLGLVLKVSEKDEAIKKIGKITEEIREMALDGAETDRKALKEKTEAILEIISGLEQETITNGI